MKTYNTKLIFENEEDKQLLLKSLELKKEAFNAISTIRFKMRKCGGLKPLHQRCYKKIKKLLPTIPSQYIIKAEQDVKATKSPVSIVVLIFFIIFSIDIINISAPTENSNFLY